MAGNVQGASESPIDERLDHFESEWNSGSAPDIRRYLSDPSASDTRYVAGLVERDLERRWRRYADTNTRTDVDQHGFPRFPLLEDYAAHASIPRGELFTPRMAATEYRVRMKWGDRPEQTDFLSRFPEYAAELEAALKEVVEHLLAESVTSNTPVDAVEGGPTIDQDRAGVMASGLSVRTGNDAWQLGRYQMESPLGRGGFGEVWKAYDPKLERHVAIKILRHDRASIRGVAAEFAREGRQLAQLGPIEGIVTVFDAGEDSGQAYIVTELIEGESLATLLNVQRFSHEESATLVAEAAAALQRAHRKGVIHRDIKPSNILIRNGNPIIADFGLAVTEEEQLLESHRSVGTIAYMPPEQAEGNSHLSNPQADIYSLGAILYRMLTNRLPFVAHSVAEYARLVSQRAPWPPRSIDETIPAELERICLKCLAKSPAERYSSASDLAAELRRFVASRDPRRPRYRQAAVLAACLLLAASIGALWTMARWMDGGDSAKVAAGKKWAANEWTEKLGQPRDMKFPGRRGLGHIAFQEDEPASLSVVADDIRLVRFGELRQSTFTFSVDIRLLDWRGTAGLFFGYRPKKHDGEDCVEIQSFRLTRVVDNGAAIIVARQKCLLQREGPVLIPIYSAQTRPIVPVARQPRLTIHVENGELTAIDLNGQPLPELMTPRANGMFPPPTFQGPWGAFTRDGTAWYINPELTVKEP